MSNKKPRTPTTFGLTRITHHVFTGENESASEVSKSLRNQLHHHSPRLLLDTAPISGDFRSLAYFYATIFVGSNKQKFTVISDTGSSLTAVPCVQCSECGTHMNPQYNPTTSTSSSTVSCSDAICEGQCNGYGTCSYHQGYMEGSSISGDLYKDKVYLGSDMGNFNVHEQDSYDKFAVELGIGCGKHEGGMFKSQLADGIMGLGNGGRSIITAMRNQGQLGPDNLFSMCLSHYGGFISFGEVDVRLHTSIYSSSHDYIPWAAMSIPTHYTVNVQKMFLMKDEIQANMGAFGPTIIDSGTSFTYLPSYVHDFCSKTMDGSRCRGAPAAVPSESLCYSITSPREDLETFPSLTFHLTPADAASEPVVVHMRPDQLFLNMAWGGGKYCLGVYNNGDGRGAVLGANAMMGHDVIIDFGGELHGPRAGFVPSDCVLRSNISGSPLPFPLPNGKTPSENGNTVIEDVPVSEYRGANQLTDILILSLVLISVFVGISLFFWKRVKVCGIVLVSLESSGSVANTKRPKNQKRKTTSDETTTSTAVASKTTASSTSVGAGVSVAPFKDSEASIPVNPETDTLIVSSLDVAPTSVSGRRMIVPPASGASNQVGGIGAEISSDLDKMSSKPVVRANIENSAATDNSSAARSGITSLSNFLNKAKAVAFGGSQADAKYEKVAQVDIEKEESKTDIEIVDLDDETLDQKVEEDDDDQQSTKDSHI
jgi:Xylanase inhibitor N-terminal/Xylanase inhibitor C-terminal